MRNKLLIVLVFQAFMGFAQKENVVKHFSSSVKALYSLKTQQIKIIGDTVPQLVNENQRLVIRELTIDKGDLIITYETHKFPKIEQGMSMEINLSILQQRANRQIKAPPNQIIGLTVLPFNSDSKTQTIIWENWVENIKPLGESLVLKMDAFLKASYPPVNCSRPPQWTTQQKLPHYIVGGIGVGLVISSLPIRNKSKDLHKSYIEQTFGEKPEALGTYTEANNKHKTANFLLFSGIGIVAADLVTLGIRHLRYKKKKKNHQYYCEDPPAKISLHPNFEQSPVGTNQLGLQLNYTF